MTTIVAGRWRGHSLKVPAKGTRPTSLRVREAIFSRLEHEGVLQNASVLDLFAGSGALAFEALSRGASRATIVDVAHQAARTCRANAVSLRVRRETAQIVQQRADIFLKHAADYARDLVFLDPPYELDNDQLEALLESLARDEDPWLHEDSLVVVERSTRSGEVPCPPALECFASKRYGETSVWYLQRRLPAPDGD